MFIIYKWTMDSMAMLSIYICLVVWNMNFEFSPILGMMIQSDELIYFSEGLIETTNQK